MNSTASSPYALLSTGTCSKGARPLLKPQRPDEDARLPAPRSFQRQAFPPVCSRHPFSWFQLPDGTLVSVLLDMWFHYRHHRLLQRFHHEEYGVSPDVLLVVHLHTVCLQGPRLRLSFSVRMRTLVFALHDLLQFHGLHHRRPNCSHHEQYGVLPPRAAPAPVAKLWSPSSFLRHPCLLELLPRDLYLHHDDNAKDGAPSDALLDVHLHVEQYRRYGSGPRQGLSFSVRMRALVSALLDLSVSTCSSPSFSYNVPASPSA
ncbi:hypothetical protein C8F04DRAFT_1273959 [Mycena alexandri]|uniref:Uncharacterized protein n=1 Tax=Mycena alexandri TaxID=1745969 RepID=A0AAD6WRV6_9AGAR|nr:hypothetical protein C8F04DRAFT_1273959 [Mycena alexandri]